MGSVLIVDDERSMREFLEICLRREGHQVSTAESGAAAWKAVQENSPDVVITDLMMPGELDGLGLLHVIRQERSDIEVIVVTAYATAETAIQAMKKGAYDYLTKPFKIDEINAVVARALEKHALVAANAVLKQRVEGRFRLAALLGKSPQMQKIFDVIGKIHSNKTSVLVTGESGTGKELVARALHSEGNRAEKPFIAVNCGAIPEELMESELFGHVKGSFTGAIADKPGLFVQAHTGTLFLDEIGELSLGLQVKLLRALQERRVKPVGGVQESDIDVRVIAATNRDLEAEVARGAFRSDLYYRLNVIEVRLPPLRHRREDIRMLVDHFLRLFAAEQGKRIAGVSPQAMEWLHDYDYPGNVRELENIIERAVALTEGSRIEVDALPRSKPSGAPDLAPPPAPASIPEEGIDLERLVGDYERKLVELALSQSNGVRKRAAQLLGVTFRSLRYRLDKMGIE